MDKYMDEAIKEAYDGIHHSHGGPFGAVIIRNGKIVGKGHNCVLKDKDPTAHGEMVAIRDACKNLNTYELNDCELYTTAEPCPMCLGAILWSGIKKVHYGCTCEDSEKINFRDTAFYEVLRGEKQGAFSMDCVDRESCQELFKDYSQIDGHVIY